MKAPPRKLRPISNDLVSELKRSIENTGLLQPIVVRPLADAYEVVFGNHRLEAFKRLGRKHIPAVVKRFSEDEAFLARISENLLRNMEVDPLEEAEGYKMLISRGWTINAIGRRVGKCDSYVCERLALLERLSPTLRTQVSQGFLKPSHAELLARIKDPVKQNEIAQLVRKRRLSVRSLEDLLNGTPFPVKLQVDRISEEWYIRIPFEFAAALQLQEERFFFMYIQHGKLILENTESSKKKG